MSQSRARALSAVCSALISALSAFPVRAQPALPCYAAARAPLRPAVFDSLVGVLTLDSARDLRGIVALRCGVRLFEHYFNGADARSLQDVRSVTKSITALLIGIAIDRGLVPGTSASLADLLPPGMPLAQWSIRLTDILSMRSGLDADDRDSASACREDRLDESQDWMAFAYRCSVRRPPGERYVYTSLDAFLAGAAVERAARESLAAFAERELFAPVGIRRFAWRRGPRGEGVGQGNLSLSARDLAALGEMLRAGGRVGTRQVVPASWVDSVWAPRALIADEDPYADTYGYYWYSKTYAVAGRSTLVHFASGNGGNKLYVVPSAGLVVAVTSAAYGQSYGQRRSERILLAVLAATMQ